jgi:hypothetical protein
MAIPSFSAFQLASFISPIDFLKTNHPAPSSEETG